MSKTLFPVVSRKRGTRHTALALAISASIALAWGGVVHAQAVNGTIHGKVPAGPDEAVRITNGAGYDRTIPVEPTGNYSVILPVGTYTVTLLQNGAVVQSRAGVATVAGGSVAVNFFSSGADATELSGVVVSSSSIPVIDVRSTQQVTTFTAEQIHRLPLGRSAEGIALMSPGVNAGSDALIGGPLGSSVVTFGGATTAENAYYLDGMNTTFALNGQGGISLPFDAIAQQQTFISGYGAKYGRSIGGVISQIGKSGTNEWHFGVRGVWQMPDWRSKKKNTYWANPYWNNAGQQVGDLMTWNQDDRFMRHVYDAYLSGPLIRDKLFLYVGLEKENTSNHGVGSKSSATMSSTQAHYPKTYVKLNWNINSNNTLAVTALQSQEKYWTKRYEYDYDRFQPGDFIGIPRLEKTSFVMWVANYTSYITDDLTVHAMFGKQRGRFYSYQPPYPGFDPDLAYVTGLSLQNPAYVPPGGAHSTQLNSSKSFPGHNTSVTNYRLDFDYRLGNHDIKFGIDNINAVDRGDGSVNTGPGYYWSYGHMDPDKPIMPSPDPSIPPYVGPPNSNPDGVDGYYVQRHVSQSIANVRVTQRAQYVVDDWQVTPNLLLNLGLRNDQFTNYNAGGVPYISLTKPQWSPRLGFSWDVHGDSSLKIFGNAGRYYLALPLSVALSIGNPVVNAGLYGTYSGIDQETGAPIGFQPLPQNPSTGVSIDSEYGQPKDPRASTSQNIKAEFSDNYVLGLQKAFQMMGSEWVFSATATYQRLNRIIDDYADIHRECDAGRRQGLDWLTPQACSQYAQSLMLINPGEDQVIMMKGPDGKLHKMNFTAEDQGFPMRPKRRYYALDLSLTHEWDGKWYGKVDYVFSRLYGNEEGPVSAAYHQSGSYESLTTAWDFPERMDNSNGVLSGHHAHTLKAFGSYAITPEWMVGGNFTVQSGRPLMCFGYYGPDMVALHGSMSYHWCNGKPAPPGSQGYTPWTHTLDLNVRYTPAWADHKLRLKLTAFNVMNKQTWILRNEYFGSPASPNSTWKYIQARTSPRTFMFTASYEY